MIVDAAFTDVVEGDFDRSEIAGLAGAEPCPPEQLEQSGLRKFWRTARAAVDRIDNAAKLPRGIVEFGGTDHGAAGAACRRGEPFHQRRAVLFDLLRLLTE